MSNNQEAFSQLYSFLSSLTEEEYKLVQTGIQLFIESSKTK